MPAGLWWFSSLVLVAAAWFSVHLWVLLSTVRARELGGLRWLALAPPLAPWLLVRTRRWVALGVWTGLAVAYLVLRSLA